MILSCGQRSTPVEDSIQDQVLYLGNGTEPQDLDPHIVTGVPEHKVLLSLLEGLVVSHPEGKGTFLELRRNGKSLMTERNIFFI